MDMNSAQDDKDARNRFRIGTCAKRPAGGSGPSVLSPADIEDAFRNPMAGWPAHGAPVPIGNPCLAPKNPAVLPSFGRVFPHHALVRGPKNPVHVALEAYGATRVSQGNV